MAGLLLKELKLRNIIEKILILTPAPLTIQWQDELRSKFSETFEIINSSLVKNQLGGNPWERFRQCITLRKKMMSCLAFYKLIGI